MPGGSESQANTTTATTTTTTVGDIGLTGKDAVDLASVISGASVRIAELNTLSSANTLQMSTLAANRNSNISFYTPPPQPTIQQETQSKPAASSEAKPVDQNTVLILIGIATLLVALK